MRDDWKLEGKVDSLSLTKGKKKIVFDIKIQPAEGEVYVVRIKRNEDTVQLTDGELAAAVFGKALNKGIWTRHDSKAKTFLRQ